MLPAARISRPLVLALRKAHQTPVKSEWKVQTPSSFVHDGWATARLPFSVESKWGFAAKAIAFLAVGFWAPFLVVEWQLRKANSQ